MNTRAFTGPTVPNSKVQTHQSPQMSLVDEIVSNNNMAEIKLVP